MHVDRDKRIEFRLGRTATTVSRAKSTNISYILNNELLKELGGGNEGEEERKRNEQIRSKQKAR